MPQSSTIPTPQPLAAVSYRVCFTWVSLELNWEIDFSGEHQYHEYSAEMHGFTKWIN